MIKHYTHLEGFQKEERVILPIRDAERVDERHDGSPGEEWRRCVYCNLAFLVHVRFLCPNTPFSSGSNTMKTYD